jgi:ABC-type nitrate/sulfonate/bicarbonate transport system permease component
MAEPIENASPKPAEASKKTADQLAAVAAAAAVSPAVKKPRKKRHIVLRGEIPAWQAFMLGACCIAVCAAIWWALTAGEIAEERMLGPAVLPSPGETFADFDNLWFEHALTRNTLVSLRRVLLGFGLAALVGIPLGVFCGCFRRVGAFFAPLTIVGRNIPVAAVIPLTLSLFGIGEFQKVMFIFIAFVAFVVMDTATAIADVSSRYIDTAYTLGAKRRQIITKVLVPLAMPGIFNSLRLLFGLAFGYIMLAEVIQTQDVGGLGSIINFGQSRGGHRTYILLVLMLIPLVALAIDRVLFWIQRQLFPYQYGGSGLLHHGLRAMLRAWESFMALFFRPKDVAGLSFGQTLAKAKDASSLGNDK